MKELKDIILAYDKAVSQKKRTALATVVKVDGSSYRRPGARMLVTEDGDLTGAISGGCLEGDALRKARYAMFQQKNKLEIYETTDDDDGRLGIQLGCNGTVHILFEPVIDEDENNPVNLLRRAVLQRKDSIIATVFSPGNRKQQTGTCYFSNRDEMIMLNDQAAIANEGQLLLDQKRSVVKEFDDHSILYQFIPPPVQLIIVGAGNDAQPLTELASLLGWDIIIADARPSYGNAERFPKATRICRVKAADLLSAVKIDEQTAVVLMTHSYNNDMAALQQLNNTDCNFIGLLGPKKKFSKMLDDLNGKGLSMNDEVLDKIHGPVGLDIGAETAEEIALSILAEIKAVFSNRDGSSLKDRPFEIHERLAITAGKP